MNVITQTIHEHVAVKASGLIVKRCGIPHSEPFPWQECPIAKDRTYQLPGELDCLAIFGRLVRVLTSLHDDNPSTSTEN